MNPNGVSWSVAFEGLAVCGLCGEGDACRVLDDEAICDDCWQRVIEDREAEDAD